MLYLELGKINGEPGKYSILPIQQKNVKRKYLVVLSSGFGRKVSLVSEV